MIRDRMAMPEILTRRESNANERECVELPTPGEEACNICVQKCPDLIQSIQEGGIQVRVQFNATIAGGYWRGGDG